MWYNLYSGGYNMEEKKFNSIYEEEGYKFGAKYIMENFDKQIPDDLELSEKGKEYCRGFMRGVIDKTEELQALKDQINNEQKHV